MNRLILVTVFAAGIAAWNLPTLAEPSRPGSQTTKAGGIPGATFLTSGTRPGFQADVLPNKDRVQAEAIVVLELFTSEGCSSCPPADALLAETIRMARKQNRKIYALSFHVDYWDRLGWTDPYGSREATRRQYRYAKALRARRVYTPQLIVNGQDQFVGSDRLRLRKSILRAMNKESHTDVDLKLEAADNTTLRVAYEVKSAPRKAVLHVAVVDHDVVSKVPTGENARRLLRHANVVRTFRTFEIDKVTRGKIDLAIPKGLEGAGSVIAYVQSAKIGTIMAATELPLPPK